MKCERQDKQCNGEVQEQSLRTADGRRMFSVCETHADKIDSERMTELAARMQGR